MTLLEWTDAISAELREAGFTVTEHRGFPLVQVPESLDEKARLLKFRLSLSSTKRIYSEGMLITPSCSILDHGRTADP